MSNSVIARWAATEITTLGVGAAIIAGVLGRGALIHIVAGMGELVIGEPRGAHTPVTPQGVVARSRATHVRIGAFVFIWQANTKMLVFSSLRDNRPA